MRHKLDAREYKLLLDPSKFPKPLSKDSANDFWHRALVPIIAARLDKRDDGSERFAKEFDTPIERLVRFWDTADCALTKAEFALRSRVEARGGEPMSDKREITLKLRMADYFVAGGTDLPGADGEAETKFEEDIAPLEVKPVDPASSVVFPTKYSIRSRYSLSTKQSREWKEGSRNVANLRHLYPTLADLLGWPATAPQEALVGGPKVREFVAKGAEVRLAENVAGRFSLTFWHIEPFAGPPAVAEVSFKCETIDGEMPVKAARRALDLFIGFQAELGDYVNTDHSSKTAMVLPKACASFA